MLSDLSIMENFCGKPFLTCSNTDWWIFVTALAFWFALPMNAMYVCLLNDWHSLSPPPLLFVGFFHYYARNIHALPALPNQLAIDSNYFLAKNVMVISITAKAFSCSYSSKIFCVPFCWLIVIRICAFQSNIL